MGVCTKWRDPIVHSETVCLSAGFCIWRVATSFIQPHCEHLVKWMWLKWSSVKWMDPTSLVSFPNAVYDHIYGQKKMQPINFWLSVFAQGYIYIYHLYIYMYTHPYLQWFVVPSQQRKALESRKRTKTWKHTIYKYICKKTRGSEQGAV